MHPMFLPRGESVPTVPVTFVNAATWREQREQLDAPRARIRRRRRASSRSPAGTSCCRRRRADWPARLFALEAADDGAQGLVRARGAGRSAAGRRLSLRQCAARFALGGARLRARRLPLHPLPQAGRKRLRLELPGNVDGDDLSRIVEGVFLARDLINTPANDMGPPELEQAARALARSPRRRCALDRRRGPPDGELPAHPRGRPRRRARAAPDRHHLGRSAAIPRSRWSARAYASIPAGSTSSPRAACST